MNDDKGDARVDSGDGGESQWTWLKGRPRPKDLTSRRGITEDRWTWLGQDSGLAPEQRNFGRILAMGLFACAAAFFFVGLVLIAINVGSGGDAQVAALHSPSSTATATVPASPLATTSAAGFGLTGWSW